MPDRTILGFDTSAAHCAAVLLRGETVLARHHEEMARGQAERLMPLLEEVLSEAGLSWHDLDAIGVGTGPGNFTGIRVAVAAARGLSLALRIPAIGVGAPAALAWGLPRPCRIAIPGRGDTVIWQDFAADEDEDAGGVAERLAGGLVGSLAGALAETGAPAATASPPPDELSPAHPESTRPALQDSPGTAAETASKTAGGATTDTTAETGRGSRPQQAAAGALPPGPAPAAPAVGIAEGVARLAAQRADRPQPRPAPVYLRPADAAPARDAPPVILD